MSDTVQDICWRVGIMPHYGPHVEEFEGVKYECPGLPYPEVDWDY